jgi:hypothetical protein
MSLRDAKDLHADITKLLLTLQAMSTQQQAADQVVQIELTGGDFKNS